MVSRPVTTVESEYPDSATTTPPQHLQTRLLNTIVTAPRGPVRTLARLIMLVPGITVSATGDVYAFVLERPQALINLARGQLALAGTVAGEAMVLEEQSQTDVEELRARVQNHIRRIGRHGNPKYAVVMLCPRI